MKTALVQWYVTGLSICGDDPEWCEAVHHLSCGASVANVITITSLPPLHMWGSLVSYIGLDWLVFNATFNILGHIVAVSFIGGGNRRPSASNWRTSQTCIHVCSGWRHVIIGTVPLITFATQAPTRTSDLPIERPVTLPQDQGGRPSVTYRRSAVYPRYSGFLRQ